MAHEGLSVFIVGETSVSCQASPVPILAQSQVHNSTLGRLVVQITDLVHAYQDDVEGWEYVLSA